MRQIDFTNTLKLAVYGEPGANRTRDNLIKSQVFGMTYCLCNSMIYLISFVSLEAYRRLLNALYFLGGVFCYETVKCSDERIFWTPRHA